MALRSPAADADFVRLPLPQLLISRAFKWRFCAPHEEILRFPDSRSRPFYELRASKAHDAAAPGIGGARLVRASRYTVSAAAGIDGLACRNIYEGRAPKSARS